MRSSPWSVRRKSWLQSFRPKFGHRFLAALLGVSLLFVVSYLSTNIGKPTRFPHPATCPASMKLRSEPARLPKLHVLILSYPRSGSSFLGDLLQSYSNAFYHFEPLHYFGNAVPTNQLDSSRKLIHDLFTCNYQDWGSFPEWAWFNSDFLTFRRNKRYWQLCTHRDSTRVLCYNICFLAAACKTAPVQIIKTIRMAASEASELLREYTDLNLKIIHLVRDPRGTMNSRQHKDIAVWCGKYKACSSPETFCKLVDKDLQHSCELQRTHPGRYMLIRYEDLALDPPGTAEKLFKFLDIDPVPNEVSHFLETHTQGNSHLSTNSFLQPPYRTVRNSTQTALEWSHKMKLKDIRGVQRSCRHVLNRLSYKMVNQTANLNAGDLIEDNIHICS